MEMGCEFHKNGRGYCGYHVGYHGQSVFCRSLLEKIYCMLLDIDKIPYLMEKQTYTIGDRNYKPDFFIYEKKNFTGLYKIIEIKDNKKIKHEYEKLYKPHFDRMGIDYSVVVFDKRKYLKHPDFKDELIYYKSKSSSYVMSGNKNPRYGQHCTVDTKRKIGKKTQERWDDPNQRNIFIDGMKRAWKSPHAIQNASKAAIKRDRKTRRKVMMAVIWWYGGYIENECAICGDMFLDRLYDDRKTCYNLGCVQIHSNNVNKWNRKFSKQQKIDVTKKRLKGIATNNFKINELENVDIDILRKRLNNKSPFSKKTIKKYFGTIDNFIRDLKQWQK